jgi:hypothetical protein
MAASLTTSPASQPLALTLCGSAIFGKPNYQAVIEGMRKELGCEPSAVIDAAIIDLTAHRRQTLVAALSYGAT